MKQQLLQALLALSFGLFACAPLNHEPDEQTPGGEDVRSGLSRVTAAAPQTNVDVTVRGLNDFTFALNRRISNPDENFASAPISISTALAMTSAGALGDTLDGFRRALRISLAQSDFHGALNTIDLALSSRGQGANGINGKPFTLKLTNQLFAQRGYPVEQSFLDLLALQYGAGVRLVEFREQPEDARTIINRFIDDRTEQLIPELLPKDSITSDTRVVLANAVYFNAAWATQFDKTATRDGDFTLGNGGRVQVATMHVDQLDARTATVGGVEVVELPYEKDEVSMLVLVPAAGQLAAVEQSLDSAALDAYVSALASEKLRLSMPKFEVKTPTNLNDALIAEGLDAAFDSHRADFNGLTLRAKDDGLHITDVLHEAVIKVSEGGTEAAGATAVIIGIETSAPVARPYAVDRPFIFVLRDRATGVVLFLGHVVDPR